MGANAFSAEAAAGAWGVCSLMAFLPEEEGWLGGQTHSPDEMERQGLALSGTPPFLRLLGVCWETYHPAPSRATWPWLGMETLWSQGWMVIGYIELLGLRGCDHSASVSTDPVPCASSAS